MAYKTNSKTLFNTILPDHKSLHELDEIEQIIDWKAIEKILHPLYLHTRGQKALNPRMTVSSFAHPKVVQVRPTLKRKTL